MREGGRGGGGIGLLMVVMNEKLAWCWLYCLWRGNGLEMISFSTLFFLSISLNPTISSTTLHFSTASPPLPPSSPPPNLSLHFFSPITTIPFPLPTPPSPPNLHLIDSFFTPGQQLQDRPFHLRLLLPLLVQTLQLRNS